MIPKILRAYCEQHWSPRALALFEAVLRVADDVGEPVHSWDWQGSKEVYVGGSPLVIFRRKSIFVHGFMNDGPWAVYVFAAAVADFLGVTEDELFLAIGEVENG